MEGKFEQKNTSAGLERLRGLKDSNRDWGQRHPRLSRFVSASLIPLALLVAGCTEGSEETAGSKVPGVENKEGQDFNEAKWLLGKIAGDRYVVESGGATIDLGGGDYYFVDNNDLLKLSDFVQGRKSESLFLQAGDKKFGRAEEELITLAGEKLIRQIGEKVLAEELPDQLRTSEKARVDLSDWLEDGDGGREQKTKEEELPSEKHINPDLADFL